MDHTKSTMNEVLGISDTLSNLIESELENYQPPSNRSSEVIEHLLRKFIGDTGSKEHLAFWLGLKFSNHLIAMRMARLSAQGLMSIPDLGPCDNPDCEACHPKSENKIILGGKPGEC